MTKVFIRNRQIDNNKQLAIIVKENDDITEFNEYSNINRGAQILSGMDKGEESEHHLQEVLRELEYETTFRNTAIPIPEVTIHVEYGNIYARTFDPPSDYIRIKTLDLEDEIPDYDLDEEDQEWLRNCKYDISSNKFEQMIEEFERACSQKILLFDEAKSLLRHEMVNIVKCVYDYWIAKRLKSSLPLIFSVRAEKAERSNSAPIDPYVAFRKRSEKMMTRKNRRVDEASYEKMYRLRQQMEKLSEIIGLVSNRELIKSQMTLNEREIFIKRYESQDFDKFQLKESENLLKRQSLKFVENFKSAQRTREENQRENKRKRTYPQILESFQTQDEQQSDDDFTFRPMVKCKYLPSRFAKVDKFRDSNQIQPDKLSNPKSFSFSKLSHLPDGLRYLNVPIRLRRTRYGTVSIDLMNSSGHHIRSDILPTSSVSACADDNDKSDTARFHLENSRVFRSSEVGQKLIRRLYTAHNKDMYCGLVPIDTPSSCANTQHNTPISQRPVPLIGHVTNVPSIAQPVLPNQTIFDNHCQKQIFSETSPSSMGDFRHQNSFSSNRNVISSSSEELVNSVLPDGISSQTSIHTTHSHLTKKPSADFLLSQHHTNDTVCTYQNSSCLTTKNNNTINNNTNTNCAFNSFVDRQLNGQKQLPTAANKELTDSQSNHSLMNGGLKTKWSQVGLNCLKSLTNKHNIPRHDDLTDITSFYSKTNGHHHHNHNHHNNHHQQKWLKQNNNPSESCLMKQTGILWTEPPHHVVTSVNKMT